MTIGLPISQGHISPVLDTATRLLVVTRRRGREVERREFALSMLSENGLARSIRELRVEVLVCAAVSEGLLRALQRHGVKVRPHVCGEVESVLHAFRKRQLCSDEFRMPGCWGAHQHGWLCRPPGRFEN